MKTGDYMDIITKDFLPPVRAWLPSFLFSAIIVLAAATLCKLFNGKRLRADMCRKSVNAK